MDMVLQFTHNDLKCVNCSDHSVESAISWYLFIEFIPITLFFIFVLLFRFNIIPGPLLGYFLFCQVNAFMNKDMYIYSY